MRSVALMIVLMTSTGIASAQTAASGPAPVAQDIASPSLYAINSAGLASAMTYCSTRHGDLLTGSPGEACFRKARQLLGTFGLKERADEVDARCHATASFNTCLTPEIGKLVYALNAEFVKQGL